MNEAADAAGSALARRVRRTWSLLKILTPREFRVRYRESVLDLAWAVITPVVFMAVYGVILTRAFNASGDCAPYVTSAWAGLVLWTFFAGALGTATGSLIAASNLITKIYFPREAIPLADVGVSLIDLGIGLVTVVLVAVVQDVSFSWHVFEALPALAVLVVWTCGLSIFASALSVFLRDIGHAVQVFLRAGFFATPVMYEASFLPDSLQWVWKVNPVGVAIVTLRDTSLCGESPRWGLVGLQLVLGALVLVASVLYMRRIEHRFTDVL